jgi:hypothetical protein
VPTPEYKTCSQCREDKPLDAYYHRDGKPIAACKACTLAKQLVYNRANAERNRQNARAWYYANPERAAATRRAYRRKPQTVEMMRKARAKWKAENPDKERESQRAYREANGLKRAARSAVATGLRNGTVVPESCLFCDDSQSEAHHHDYTLLPLVVTWLCRYHHGLAHREVD